MSDSVLAASIGASVTLVVAFLTQFLAESYKRFRDGAAVAGGIAGELSTYDGAPSVLRKMILGWVVEARAGRHLMLPLRPIDRPTDLYFDKAVEKFGLLSPDMIEHTVFVYTHLRAYRLGLEILQQGYKEMTAEEFIGRCARILEMLDRAEGRALFLVPHLRYRAKAWFLSPEQVLPKPE